MASRSAMVAGEAAIEAFGAGLRGQLLRPGDDHYDAARALWNAMIDKRPALIARCAGTADVMRSVVFARDHGLLVSVRGGGHNVAGNAVCDSGLMIDLSPGPPAPRRAAPGAISTTSAKPSVWLLPAASSPRPVSPG
jgi:hypothetical protein